MPRTVSRRLSTAAPPCGGADCTAPATHADASGVGWCKAHRDAAPGRTWPVSAEHPFDPWWSAAITAETAGGAEAERWSDLEWGQWPAVAS